jgi:hypothetical protein
MKDSLLTLACSVITVLAGLIYFLNYALISADKGANAYFLALITVFAVCSISMHITLYRERVLQEKQLQEELDYYIDSCGGDF